MGSSKGQGQTKAVCALPHMSHTSGPVGFIMLLDTYSENGFSFSFRFFFFFLLQTKNCRVVSCSHPSRDPPA